MMVSVGVKVGKSWVIIIEKTLDEDVEGVRVVCRPLTRDDG